MGNYKPFQTASAIYCSSFFTIHYSPPKYWGLLHVDPANLVAGRHEKKHASEQQAQMGLLMAFGRGGFHLRRQKQKEAVLIGSVKNPRGFWLQMCEMGLN